MDIAFYGATERVTGSCHIVHAAGRTLLLDCGLVQGSDADEALNRKPFPFDPASIDAVILSHGHIDHSGRIPLLLRQGFKGPVYAQHATRDLCSVLLLDSAVLSERDALYRQKHPHSASDRYAEPLYTRQDAVAALNVFKGLPYGQKHELFPGVSLRFRDAGHILGSALVELWLREGESEKKLVFSGDLGQYGSPVLNDPERVERGDAVLIESTYGNRVHRKLEETIAEIGELISAARQDGGNIVIPAFAVGRSQELLYLFAEHYEAWGMENWKVFLDSPMAIEASRIYWSYPDLFDAEAAAYRNNPSLLPPLHNLHFTPRVEQSQAINAIHSGAIIIAGSGMCNGGRILHHLKHNIHRPECHILFTGYQAEGTLGRALVDGAREVSMHGRKYSVAAHLHTIGGLSAHGDRDDMVRWASGFSGNPEFFVVHGDPPAKTAFRDLLQERLGVMASIPAPGERYWFGL